MPFSYFLRPDLLKVLLLEPSRSIFSKKKFKKFFDHVIEFNIHARARGSSQMARLWLSVEVVSGCNVLFGSRIVNCSQEEAFGNLLSRLGRLEEDKF